MTPEDFVADPEDIPACCEMIDLFSRKWDSFFFVYTAMRANKDI